MGLGAGVIAGVAIVGVLGLVFLSWLIYYIVKRRREQAAYEEKCGKLWKKYSADVVGNYQVPETSYVRTPVAWQQLTPAEINMTSSSTEFTVPLRPRSASDREQRAITSMNEPIHPEHIDPRIYSDSHIDEAKMSLLSERPAQLFFSLEFNEELSILNVFIDQARNLRPRTLAGTCDPYCIVKVEPGNIEKKTKVVRSCVDPLFQETFSFEISKQQLKEKVLKVNIFDYDQFSRHECTGVIVQSLSEINMEAKVDIWKRIVPTAEAEQLRGMAGDLLLRLAYLRSAEKLTVVLLKARNLKCFGTEEDVKPPDPYIRVTLLHDGNMLKKKKTSTKRRNVNPTYNQAINFAVPLDMLPQVEIQFHIVHDSGSKLNRSSRKEIIGYLEIGPHSRGDEYEHWKDLMSNKPQARWHHLVVTNERHQDP